MNGDRAKVQRCSEVRSLLARAIRANGEAITLSSVERQKPLDDEAEITFQENLDGSATLRIEEPKTMMVTVDSDIRMVKVYNRRGDVIGQILLMLPSANDA